MGRVTFGRAGRSSDDSLVAVLVRELRDGLRLRLAAAGAGEGLYAALGFRRLLRHFAVVPCVTQSVHISVHVAVAAGAGVRRVALGRAGRRCDNILVAVGMGNIIVMDVGVFQRVISGANCNAIPRRLSTGEIYICERSATFESIMANACHAVRDRHAGQRFAIRESKIANARHAVRDRHACKRFAIIESFSANARHAVRDRHAGQRCAIFESTMANARHAVRDRITSGKSTRALHQSCLIFIEQNTGCIAGVMTAALSDPYTGQRCTRSESGITNARHAVRDRHAGQRCATTESQTTNARHAVRDRHTGQRCATSESRPANACHAVRDRHARQRCAIRESRIANARHSVWDRHAGQRCAILESMPANARHAVRDRHAGQRCAKRESDIANARHAVRDRICRKSARALHQSSLIFVEQNTGCIAGVMTVALSDPYTSQRCTRSESANANACHAVRDRHAGQRCAIKESISANARHAVRDRHAGQRCAIIESKTANARHAFCNHS